jgi:hypothetical protein
MVMKKISGFILIYCLVVAMASGQELRTKTNEVHLAIGTPRSKTTVPVITWITPKLEWSSSVGNQVEIEARVQSDVPIRSIKIFSGDQSSGASRGQKTIEVNQTSLLELVKQKLFLESGSNYIEIVAENVSGGQVSAMRNITVGVDALTSLSADRKDYALLFATDNYDYWTDLVNPVYDANAIATELREKYGFEVDVVENANQEDVLVKIKDYSKRNYKPQDQLFIFFAGHGQFDEGFGEGYVVAKNSLEADKAKTTYISHSNLRTYVNNIACDHILLAMDVCFGGTLDPVIARARGIDEKDELTTNEFLVRKLSKKTRRYITSGGKEYVSDGVVGKHSPFATRFLEALKSRGGEDGILTTAEIDSFLEKIKQHEPRSGGFGDNEKGSDFVFVIRN